MLRIALLNDIDRVLRHFALVVHDLEDSVDAYKSIALFINSYMELMQLYVHGNY